MYKISWYIALFLSVRYCQAILVQVDILKSPTNQLIYLYSDYHDFDKPDLAFDQLARFVEALVAHEKESNDKLVLLVEEIPSWCKRSPCITSVLAPKLKERKLANTSYENIEVRKALLIAPALFKLSAPITATNKNLETYTFRTVLEEIKQHRQQWSVFGTKHERDICIIDCYTQGFYDLLEQNNVTIDCSLVSAINDLHQAGKRDVLDEFVMALSEIGACFFDIALCNTIETHQENKIVVVAGRGHMQKVKLKLRRDGYRTVVSGDSKNSAKAKPEPLMLSLEEFKERQEQGSCIIA